jgi:hypothetical protein
MQQKSKGPNLEVVKMAGFGLFLGLIFSALAFAGATMNESIDKIPLYSAGRYYLIISLLLCVAILISGLIFRRALFIHLFFSALTSSSLIMPLIANYELSLKSESLAFLTIALCVVQSTIVYRSNITALTSKNTPAVKSGRLDIKSHFWDLKKHMIQDKSDDFQVSIAKAIIPLGGALGTFVFRSFPDKTSLFIIIANCIWISVISSVIGIHLATSRYINLIEKKYKSNLLV